MLGGDDDEDDLQVLLEQCGSMVDRPALRTLGQEAGAGNSRSVQRESRGDSSQQLVAQESNLILNTIQNVL